MQRTSQSLYIDKFKNSFVRPYVQFEDILNAKNESESLHRQVQKLVRSFVFSTIV